MTRLANGERAGYFPLPLSVINLVCTHMAAPKDGRILAPCAGEGAALVTLADKLGLEPFGVELHEGRVKAAREAVSQLMASRHDSDKGGASTAHGTRTPVSWTQILVIPPAPVADSGRAASRSAWTR